MAALIDGPRVLPRQGKAEQLVVLCHGFGADGNDLIGLAPHWQQKIPTAAFVAPNAPMPCEMSPRGYQWFPVSRMNPEEALKGARAAAPLLENFIDGELARLKLDGSRLALVGFSQGTMMALHVGLRRRQSPAVILGYSGALIAPELLTKEMTARPPVLLVHGDMDEMIPLAAMQAAVNALGGAGIQVQWHVCHGVGHGIDPVGLKLGESFLADGFAGRLGERRPETSFSPIPRR
jgi:phospholipase/carboxylesterase